MSTSVTEILRGLVSPSLMNAVGPLVGLSADTASRGLGDAISRFLGALVDRSGDAGAMSSIADMANNLARDQSGLSDIKGLLAGGIPSTAAILAGNQLMGNLFGVWQAAHVHKIAGALGAKAEAGSSLFNLAAPLVLSALGKRLGGGALTGAALSGLLGQEKTGLLAGFLPSLGVAASAVSQVASAAVSSGASTARAAAGTAAAATATAAASASRAAAPRDNGIFSSFLWLLLPLIFVGWLLWTKMNEQAAEAPAPAAQTETAPEEKKADSAPAPAAAPEPAPAAAPEPAPAPEPTPAAAPEAAPGGLARIALAGGTDIEAAADGVETKILAFINDASAQVDKNLWFNFDRLNFETGSSNLTAESKSQVANIVAIMNAFPAVKLKIGGYTDNVGNPDSNLKLSDSRAQKVREAIVAGGVAADRVEAEGYGEQHAVADNGTPEGRALNRRTAVSVRAK